MTADRSFSSLVHSINEDLMGRDRQKRELARNALSHLGFVE
ncbi:hypothetical protein [Poseidonocella sedimentorum]|nr:hypothetical protein [Poseidonocella sedimentorum]